LNGLALCAGYGGLEIGIERVFPEYRTVCYVEGEAFAASHIVKKMEEGRMDNAPIWSNVRTFDGKPWRGKVDIISGGFPCQPYSGAGKQMGKDDPRDLWLDFVRIIGEVRPGFIFLENVPNIVKWRLNEIVLDLDLLGYNAAWCVVAASNVGAPHRRKRWFLFAVLDSERDGFGQSSSKEDSDRVNKRGKMEGSQSKAFGSVDPDSNNTRKRPTGRTVFKENRPNFSRVCSKIPNTDSKRLERKTTSGLRRKGLFSTSTGCGGYGREFEEWWKVEPGMGRLVDGATDWVDRIRILGNGVVPQQAAYALQILGERLAWGMVENRTPKL